MSAIKLKTLPNLRYKYVCCTESREYSTMVAKVPVWFVCLHGFWRYKLLAYQDYVYV